MDDQFIKLVRDIYGNDFVPLHRPVFEGNEKRYTLDCIDSNFVSSAGEMILEFEQKVATYTGSKYAIATVNGTAALHTCIKLSGANSSTEVITQALTFVATGNAINYCGSSPIFLDVDIDSMGLSPKALKSFLSNHTIYKDGKTINRQSGKHIIACIPMHTFGNVCRIEELLEICNEYNIQLIEDAAESLGSLSNNKHTGTFGVMGAISFNGNKIITTGGGGMIITDDENLAIKAKHITTTAKIAHPYEYNHDQIGFNYRMPNLNAALGKAQVENLDYFIKEKRLVAKKYMNFFDEAGVGFVTERAGTVSNYWLNAILLSNSEERDSFIKSTNKAGVMTRPIWTLMTDLDMFKDCQHDDLSNSIWLQARVVNIPSSVPNML